MGLPDHLAGMDRFRSVPAELTAGVSLVPTTSRVDRLYGLCPRRNGRFRVHLLAPGGATALAMGQVISR
jgi:hypothetical protein